MKKLLIVASLTLTLASCYNDKYDKLYPTPAVVTCDTTAVSYASVIQPIFNTYCISCHVAGGSGSSYGDLTTYNSTWTGTKNLSNMVRDINIASLTDVNHMPQNTNSLSSCNISKITAWVNQGAQNN